jgi:hypothetical protein
LFTNISSWQAKQSIPHTAATFYGDYMKMCEDFAPNFGDKELAFASRQFTVSHFLFHQGIFCTQHNMTVVPHPPNRKAAILTQLK